MNVLPSIAKDSRLDSTVEALMSLITSGTVAFGDLLPAEAELCRQMGVSRPTVREAIRILQSRGLVLAQHGVGVRVTDRTTKVAADSILRMLKQKGVGSHDMLEVRLMLECQAAALAAERATPADISTIAAAIEAMAVQPRSLEENVKFDFDFHLRVAEASHNLVLVTLMDAIRDLLYKTILATHTLDSRIGIRISLHSAVLHGIQQHDPEAAQGAMRAHLEETKYLVSIVEAGQSTNAGGEEQKKIVG